MRKLHCSNVIKGCEQADYGGFDSVIFVLAERELGFLWSFFSYVCVVVKEVSFFFFFFFSCDKMHDYARFI